MMKLMFKALPTELVRNFQGGALDANGQQPERAISDGSGNPCRHCLTEIPSGDSMLILSFKPFTEANPYSESGPIFLCESACTRYADSNELPEMLAGWEKALIRGYNANGRIVYGTGSVVSMQDVPKAASQIFEDEQVSYIHLRSSSYNCYQCRVDRA